MELLKFRVSSLALTTCRCQGMERVNILSLFGMFSVLLWCGKRTLLSSPIYLFFHMLFEPLEASPVLSPSYDNVEMVMGPRVEIIILHLLLLFLVLIFSQCPRYIGCFVTGTFLVITFSLFDVPTSCIVFPMSRFIFPSLIFCL